MMTAENLAQTRELVTKKQGAEALFSVATLAAATGSGIAAAGFGLEFLSRLEEDLPLVRKLGSSWKLGGAGLAVTGLVVAGYSFRAAKQLGREIRSLHATRRQVIEQSTGLQ